MGHGVSLSSCSLHCASGRKWERSRGEGDENLIRRGRSGLTSGLHRVMRTNGLDMLLTLISCF